MKNPSLLLALATVRIAVCFLTLSLSEAVHAVDNLVEIIPGKSDSSVSISPTGAATTTIPLTLPVGTNAVTPTLSLVYRSDQSDGILGRGWSISGLGSISRCSSNLAIDGISKGVSYGAGDKFCLNGQRLILESGQYGNEGSEYRLEINTNQRVVASGFQYGAPESFKVYSPDGRIFEYGGSADSRVEIQNQDKVNLWALNRITDLAGNYIRFDYHEDNESGEFYPLAVAYTGNDQQQLEPYNHISFEYEGRSDPFFSCINGGLSQTAVKLKSVKIFKHVPNDSLDSAGESKLFRKYLLNYEGSSGTQSRKVPNSTCDEQASGDKPPLTDVQITLNRRYEDENALLERIQRYQIGAREVLNPSEVGVVPIFQEILASIPSLTDNTAHAELTNRLLGNFMRLYNETMSFSEQSLALSNTSSEVNENEDNQYILNSLAVSSGDYIASLENRAAYLEEQLSLSNSMSEAQLQDKIALLEAARDQADSQLVEHLRLQIKKAHKILTVPSRSRKKQILFEELGQNLKAKYRASSKAADDCLAAADLLKSGQQVNETQSGIGCAHAGYSDALSRFVKYGEASKVYFDLYSRMFEGEYSLRSQVEKSHQNHLHHLLVSGQIASIYEQFADQVRREAASLWEQDISVFKRRLAELAAGQELSLLAGSSTLEGELRDVRFQLGLMNAESPEQYFEEYIANLGMQLDSLYQETQNSDYITTLVEDSSTEPAKVFESLSIIANFDRVETNVNYQAILESLIQGENSRLASGIQANTGSLTREARLSSITECASDDSCFHPIQFAWNAEYLGWVSESNVTPAPDSVLSYGEIIASNAGLLIDTNMMSDGSGASEDQEQLAGLTSEEMALGKELALSGKLADVNGDGLVDWVLSHRTADGTEFRGSWLNTGDGWVYADEYTMPVTITDAQGLLYGAFIDLNNDGADDWLASLELADGTLLNSAYLSSESGWSYSAFHSLPSAMYEVVDSDIRVNGELFVSPNGAISWVTQGGDNGELTHSFTLGANGWEFQANQQSIATVYEGALARGMQVDINGDGALDWFQHEQVSDSEDWLRAWLFVDGEWVRNEGMDINSAGYGVLGRFLDINADGLPDWLLSVLDDSGTITQKTLINTGVGWQEDVNLLFPPFIDQFNNEFAHLIDLNEDGIVEWVQAIHNVHGQIQIETRSFQNGSWVVESTYESPYVLGGYADPDTFTDYGTFTQLSGSPSLDWLNTARIWSAIPPPDSIQSLSDSALLVEDGNWTEADGYRLPVLEQGWLRRVSDIRVALNEGTFQGDAEGDLGIVASATLNSSEDIASASPQYDANDVAPLVFGDSEDSVQESQLIDVDGDGRLDWVKSIQFSDAARQSVVWIRSSDGWTQSQTFIPPAPLISHSVKNIAKIVDLNSDGLPDFFRSIHVEGYGTTNELWLNNGSEWVKNEDFSFPTSLRTFSADNTVQTSAILVDLNSDGLLDVVENAAPHAKGELARVFINQNGSWSESSSFISPGPLTQLTSEGNEISAGQFVDINGDGVVDWVAYSFNQDKVWLNSGDKLIENPEYELLTSMRESNGEISAVFIDLNADGLVDIARSYAYINELGATKETRISWLNTGSGWRPNGKALPGLLMHSGRGKQGSLADVNGDGYIDFLAATNDPSFPTNALFLGTADGWVDYSSSVGIPIDLVTVTDSGLLKRNYIVADIDGDHQLDLVSSSESGETRYGGKSIGGVIRNIYDGSKRSEIAYEKGYKPYSVSTTERANYPLRSVSGPSVVASGLRSLMAESLQDAPTDHLLSDSHYTFSNFAIDLFRSARVGPALATVVDWQSERITETSFNQHFPFAGNVSKSVTKSLWHDPVSIVHFDYDALMPSGLSWDEHTQDIGYSTYPTALNQYFTPYVEKTISENYKADASLLNTIESIYQPNSRGQSEITTTIISEGGFEYKTVETLTYNEEYISESKWLLNLISTKKVEKSDDTSVNNSTPKSVVTSNTFYPNGLLKTTETNGLKERYVYDPFGNTVQKISGEGSGFVPRTEIAKYDSKGRFRISTTNVLGEMQDQHFTSISDGPSKIILNDGSFTSFFHDQMGRKTKEKASNGVTRLYRIKYCEDLGSGSYEMCPENAVYVTMQYDNAVEGSAAETVYYDRIGRELRRATSNAKGLTFIDTAYQFNGQVEGRTLPYHPDSEMRPHWVLFAYDSFGRTTAIQRPDGSIERWVHDGRTVTAIDQLGASTITINTPFGSPAEVIDAEQQSTRYTYNQIGQLVETRDPANNPITVTYDSLGYRSSVQDPDHGLTTFKYNVFGDVLWKKDAIGNKETYSYDPYGRRESRIDTGFDRDGNVVPAATTTWKYYELSSATAAYNDYVQDLVDSGYEESEYSEFVTRPVFLNAYAKSELVEEIVYKPNGEAPYRQVTTYDYRGRPAKTEVVLPDGQSRTLETSYVGETDLPDSIRYPNNFSIRYEYDDFGYLKHVSNGGLNTLDHYNALTERATYLDTTVAPALYARSDRIKNGSLKDLKRIYERRVKKADDLREDAVVAGNKADHFIRQVNDDGYAIRHLQGKLTSITSQTDSNQRFQTAQNVAIEFTPIITGGDGCSAGEPVIYELYVPTYEVEVPHPENLGETTVETVPAHIIQRELPRICLSTPPPLAQGHPDQTQGQRQATERQVVDFLIGLMTKLRERRDLNRSAVASWSSQAAEKVEQAKAAYRVAGDYYRNSVLPLEKRVSGLIQAGNEVRALAYNTSAKAYRVSQFYEVERDIKLWSAIESDARNRTLVEKFGNEVTTSREYHPISGALESIQTKNAYDEIYQSEHYAFDWSGNLRYRLNGAIGTSDTFVYDELGRLTKATYAFEQSGSKVEQTFDYDNLGNIIYKSDVGAYSYHPTLRPHAVLSAGDRVYEYDDIGRMISGDGTDYWYSTFSKPIKIKNNNNEEVTFKYGPDRSRYYQKRNVGGSLSETFYFFNGLYEETHVGGAIRQNVSISAAGKNIATLSGQGEIFAFPTELPEVEDAEDLVTEIENNVRANQPALKDVFTAFNSVLNSVDLVSRTTVDDQIRAGDAGDCIDQGQIDDPDALVLDCLGLIQIEEVYNVVASALLNIQYFHYDHLDSVKAISNGAGKLVGINYYDAFGSPIIEPSADSDTEEQDKTESNIALGGHEAISGFDLIHMNGRVYNPEIARFLSADPFIPFAFGAQGLNRYSYVYNNPLRYTDPTGYSPLSASDHEANEYIFVSLSYFYLETVLPSSQHLYDLLELSRNDPATFDQHITAWGSNPDKWQAAVNFIQPALQSRDAVRQIREAERQTRYLTIASIAITAATAGSTSGWLSQWWAAPTLSAGAQLAVTGELDYESVALSFATAYVGSELIQSNVDASGNSYLSVFNQSVTEGQAFSIRLVATSTLRGFGSHLNGGEFEHGFGAGLAEGLLNRYVFPEVENPSLRILRSGVIQGIVVEIANETRNGERLDFFDGLQLGVLREGGSLLITTGLGGGDQFYCFKVGCGYTIFGDLLNLIIEDGDPYSVVSSVGSLLGAVLSMEVGVDDFKRDDRNRIQYERSDRFEELGVSFREVDLLFSGDPQIAAALSNGDKESAINRASTLFNEAGISTDEGKLLLLANLFGLDVGEGSVSYSNLVEVVQTLREGAAVNGILFGSSAAGVLLEDVVSRLENGEIVSLGEIDGNVVGVRIGQGSSSEIVLVESGSVTVVAEYLKVSETVSYFTLNRDQSGDLYAGLFIFPESDLVQLVELIDAANYQAVNDPSGEFDQNQPIRILVTPSTLEDALAGRDNTYSYGRKNINGELVFFSIDPSGRIVYEQEGGSTGVSTYYNQLREELLRQEAEQIKTQAALLAQQRTVAANQAMTARLEDFHSEYPENNSEFTPEEIEQHNSALFAAAMARIIERQNIDECGNSVCEGSIYNQSELDEYIRQGVEAEEILATRGYILDEWRGTINSVGDTGLAIGAALDPTDPINVAITVFSAGLGPVVRITNSWGGKSILNAIRSRHAYDEGAHVLAGKFRGGFAQAEFPGHWDNREFDWVSDLYIGQTKPGGFSLGANFRGQAQTTIEAGIEMGKIPYFHFNGLPKPGVIEKLNEYGARYNVTIIIDTKIYY